MLILYKSLILQAVPFFDFCNLFETVKTNNLDWNIGKEKFVKYESKAKEFKMGDTVTTRGL